MDLTTVYSKTTKGAQAITQKGKHLPADLARVLNLVDGRSTVEEILKRADKLPTSTLPQTLADLAKAGYHAEKQRVRNQYFRHRLAAPNLA